MKGFSESVDSPTHSDTFTRRYTSTFNLVDYPSIAFPTGSRVSVTEDYVPPAEKAAYISLSAEDQIVHDNCKQGVVIYLATSLVLMADTLL